ncbi:unnamed protein product [Prunus armeniaca]
MPAPPRVRERQVTPAVVDVDLGRDFDPHALADCIVIWKFFRRRKFLKTPPLLAVGGSGWATVW